MNQKKEKKKDGEKNPKHTHACMHTWGYAGMQKKLYQ